MKRCFDVMAAAGLLVIGFPIMVIVACGIRLFISRNVVFKQQRPGRHGVPFFIYKFRTMTDAVDEDGKLLPDAMRMTAFGGWIRRLSLDELPQLLNVVRGDLSLVGPRPLLMEYLPLYTSEQARRHLVRPGITGWAQVNGRNAISWEEKFALDVWYVDNQSFWLDLKILWLTLLKVVKSEGITAQGHVTIEPFKGSRNV